MEKWFVWILGSILIFGLGYVMWEILGILHALRRMS